MKLMAERCALCGVETELTLHHLVPQARCKNKYKQVKDDPSNHLYICRQCHDAIHAAYTETELRDSYCTLEALREAPAVKKFVAWRQKHPDFNGHSKMSVEKKRKR